MGDHTCQFVFNMPGKKRDICNLPAMVGKFCYIHTLSSEKKNFFDLLNIEIQKQDHWLEGIIFSHDLNGMEFSHVNMPNANFEGRNLESISFSFTNLQGAIFRSASLSHTSFNSSILLDAIFDQSEFNINEKYSLDLRNAEIGGASFTDVNFVSVRLQNIKISKPLKVKSFLESTIFEFENGDWGSAAYIYLTFADRAKKDWENDLEDYAMYMAMTCRHRLILSASPLINKITYKNWLTPSINLGLPGLGWYLHRYAWGYGFKPFRLFGVMFVVIGAFALLFGFANITNNHFTSQIIESSLYKSAQSFLSMNGSPSPDKLSKIIETIEAFFGYVLFSLFIVSLSVKFMRRT